MKLPTDKIIAALLGILVSMGGYALHALADARERLSAVEARQQAAQRQADWSMGVEPGRHP